ncbi:MAG: class II aldolase/adducin family protein [Anaerolineae bacterium]|nr:class II aldolase/adducin family protein [Anaerolineae bacterium]
MGKDGILEKLISMTRFLGEPAQDFAILGEGNTSARADAETFWVKASGVHMGGIDADGFVQVRFDKVMELLQTDDLGDDNVKAGLNAAKIDPSVTVRPSVETTLHALALQLDGVNFVGHTHPTAVNAILCSQIAEEAISGSLFPDMVVYCGALPAYVPLTDPGVLLARAVQKSITEYQDAHGFSPKVILMQNHGLIALGATASQVQATTSMYVKAARIVLGTYALGGPHFLDAATVSRIDNRGDINYRRRKWGIK